MSDEALPTHARTSRPQFFEEPGLDQMMSILLGVAQELSVLRDRVDSIERILDAKGSLTRAELEAYRPDVTAEAERQQRRSEYLRRIFRVIGHQAGRYTSAEAETQTLEFERALQESTLDRGS